MLIDFKSLIFYEHDFLLVLNKLAWVLVHPTVNEDSHTLYNYLKNYYQEQNLNFNIHPVSRLDRNTSGLVMFAKEPEIQFLLSKTKITKKYFAIVKGIPTPPSGIIEAAIARNRVASLNDAF